MMFPKKLLICLCMIFGNRVDSETISDNSVQVRDPLNKTEDETPIDTKIVGGVDAVANEFPWIIYIQDKDRKTPFCGGVIIKEDVILTAAHCMEDTKASQNQIVAGAHLWRQSESSQQVRNIKTIRIHENYDGDSFENDICILKLSSKLTFNTAVKNITLPSASMSLPSSAIVAGWGSLSYGATTISNILKKVSVPMVAHATCVEQYKSGVRITNDMICYGEEGKDSCQGDSGGGLMCKTNNIYVVCGIVSFGNGCAIKNFAGVYTKVQNYLKWIEKNYGYKNHCNHFLLIILLFVCNTFSRALK